MTDYLAVIEELACDHFSPWSLSLLGTLVVSLTGLFPLMVISIDNTTSSQGTPNRLGGLLFKGAGCQEPRWGMEGP